MFCSHLLHFRPDDDWSIQSKRRQVIFRAIVGNRQPSSSFVKRIVDCGSRRQHLQLVALDIFGMCFRYGIHLDMEWIPRSLNKKADYISRIKDFDDWKVNPILFNYIDTMWGPHSVDCFASIENTQLPKFYSRFWCPGTSAVDAFTVNWAGDVDWWVPPIYLVSHTIRHAEDCKAMGTLLLPA